MRSALYRPCVLCGSTDRDVVVAVDWWRVGRCPGCGLHTLAPEPNEVRLEGFEDGSEYVTADALRADIMARHAHSLAAVERFVPPGRLLDVGCGLGFLLEAARDRGWNAVGVEPAGAGADRARGLGFEVHQGMLEDLSLPEGSFDAIALLQVVEHIPDPRPLLDACRRLLRPGGALLVATPNPASVLARVKRERFNYWIPPIHCVWYTPAALARTLRGAGFAIVREETWSARTAGLHDGVDIVSSTRLGRLLPRRARRAAGGWVARAADAAGYGSIVEQIALRWEDA